MEDPPGDRNRLMEAQDHLIELFIQHDEASRAGDQRRLNELNRQIDRARLQRDDLRPK